MTSHTWQSPPSRLEMAPDEVHIWCANLDRSAAELTGLARHLTEGERDRAAKMKEGPIRNEFVAARGLLRTLLSLYRPLPPCDFRFRAGPTGKPYLDGIEPALHFNVSHSGEMGLFALSGRAEVGVDVERFRPFKNVLSIAQRWFRPPEVEILRTLDDDARLVAFFRSWTLKEALLKASGIGLGHGLTRVEVTLAPQDPPRVVFIENEEGTEANWSLTQLVPQAGYVGALAVQCHDYRLVCWRWPDSV